MLKKDWNYLIKILKKYPDSYFLQWMYGLALHKSGKNEEALEILKEADQKYMGYLKDFKDDIEKSNRLLPVRNSKNP